MHHALRGKEIKSCQHLLLQHQSSKGYMGATQLMYDCRYLNLVRLDSRSIEIRQRDCHAFGNGKDRIVTHKYFIDR